MIDIKFLRENPDVVRASQKGRGENVELVDQIIAIDEIKRAALSEFETLRQEQNVLSKSVGAAKGDEKAALLANAKELADKVKAADTKRSEIEEKAKALLLQLSNLLDTEAPIGGEEDFVTIEHVGTPLELYHKPISHFVAGFLGSPPMNFIPVKLDETHLDLLNGKKLEFTQEYVGPAVLGIRPEKLQITKGVDSALASAFEAQITPFKLVESASQLNTIITLTASGRLIAFDADLTYVVPSETRTANIYSESRAFTVDKETREYTLFDSPGDDTIFIFLDGGKVDPRAYTYLASGLNEANIDALFLNAPFNLHILSPFKSSKVIKDLKDKYKKFGGISGNVKSRG